MNQETTTESTEAPEQPMLPGMEELAAENETLKADLCMRSAVYDVESRLTRAGARSPALLAERAKESFQFSAEGDLINAQAVVEHFRKAYPEQFTASSIDATAGRTTRPAPTKEALARMTPAEIQRLDWNEVRHVLST